MNSKLLHFYYYIIGGFYSAPALSRTVKGSIIFYYITVSFLLGGGVLGYSLTSEEIDAFAFGLLCGIVDSIITSGSILVITHSFHKEFDVLLDYIEKHNSTRFTNAHGKDYKNIYIRKSDSMKEATFWKTLGMSAVLSYGAVAFIDMIFLGDGNSFKDLKHHLYAYPYLNSLPNTRVAAAIFILELGVLLAQGILAFSKTFFTMVISTELNNIVVHFCEEIKKISHLIAIKTDVLSERKMSQMELETFEKNFTVSVQKYQKFIKMVDMIRPYVEIFNTLWMIVSFLALLLFGYIALLPGLQTVVKVKFINAVTIYGILFYGECMFGYKFNNMSEAMQYEVYNMPWYALPPKHRKVVYIFLCEVQQPIEFKALKVYPVDRLTFPHVTKAVYSYVSVLRSTINTGRFSGNAS